MEAHDRVVEWESEYRRMERMFPERPKLVYLAHCYRSARGEHGVDQYIHEASVVGRQIMKLGLGVHVPGKNTAFWGGMDIPTECFLLADFEFIRRYDAIVLHPNWESSAGAQRELEVAREAGLPVFYWPEHKSKLAHWAKGGVGVAA